MSALDFYNVPVTWGQPERKGNISFKEKLGRILSNRKRWRRRRKMQLYIFTAGKEGVLQHVARKRKKKKQLVLV